MNTGFSLIASCYDRFNCAGYKKYLAFFQYAIEKYADIKVNEVLDLGCGTGEMTRLLAESGYDLAALDGSAEMLAEATEKCAGLGVLFSCQDMRDFELYGTVQATLCSFDCINYLLSEKDVESCFSLVNNYTEKGGVFVFDINTPYRYENVFGANAYVYEDEGEMLVWQNSFNPKSGFCDFYLSRFERRGDGAYTRGDDVQRQRRYFPKRIKRLLEKCGFEVCAIYGDTDCAPFTENSEKAYFVAKSVSGRAQG